VGDLPIVYPVKVEYDTPLTAVPHLKCWLDSRLITLGWLDLDDVSAVIGKYHRRQGTRHT
jgi:hypothetical protein